MRLLLKAGVPVVPCGVRGSYDVWPRWSKKIRRHRVRLEFGEPILWPAMNTRQERNAALEEAYATLGDRLGALSAWEAVNPVDPPWLAVPEESA